MDSDYENEDSVYVNTNSNKLSSYRESMQNILLGL